MFLQPAGTTVGLLCPCSTPQLIFSRTPTRRILRTYPHFRETFQNKNDRGTRSGKKTPPRTFFLSFGFFTQSSELARRAARGVKKIDLMHETYHSSHIQPVFFPFFPFFPGSLFLKAGKAKKAIYGRPDPLIYASGVMERASLSSFKRIKSLGLGSVGHPSFRMSMNRLHNPPLPKGKDLSTRCASPFCCPWGLSV